MYSAPYEFMTKKERELAGQETLRGAKIVLKLFGVIFVLYIIGTIIGLIIH